MRGFTRACPGEVEQLLGPVRIPSVFLDLRLRKGAQPKELQGSYPYLETPSLCAEWPWTELMYGCQETEQFSRWQAVCEGATSPYSLGILEMLWVSSLARLPIY